MYNHNNTITTHFVHRLAYRPHAANRKDQFYPKWAEEAVTMRYIEPERPTEISWVKLDMDCEGSAARWIDEGYPRPHIIIRNKNKEGAHLMWGLETPVLIGQNSRPLPRKLYAEVTTGLTALLGGDPGYTGFGVKNPLSNAWHTDLHNAPLYSLKDLQEALPDKARRTAAAGVASGAGRNADLFSRVIAWGYAEVSSAKQHGTEHKWSEAVQQYAHQMNAYQPKLSRSEVNGIAKRVARYTWQSWTPRFDGDADNLPRNRRLSHLREPITPEEARRRLSEGGKITSALLRNQRYDTITAAIAELAGRGILNPSARQIAEQAGVSARTVFNFRRESGQAGQGN